MAGRSPLSKRRQLLLDEELNIAPIMNLFLVLIPSLMASIVLVKVGQIDAPIPKVVDSSQAPAPQKGKKPFELLTIIDNTGLIVRSNAIPGRQKVIPNVDGELDIPTFHALLISLKRKFPEERTINIKPRDMVIYQNLVKVMDASRELDSDDPDLPGKPRPKGIPVDPSHWELFPDVVMEGVI